MEVTSAVRDSCSSTAKSRSNSLSGVAIVLSYAILLGGVITIGITAYMVIVSYSSLPYADGWDEAGAVAYGSSPLKPAWLWTQHSEHRLVIPKIFLAIDLSLFQAKQIFLLASIWLIQLLHLLLLGWSMRVLGGWSGSVWRTGVGLAAFCLFCPAQWENFVWGFQVCFVLPGLFATASFVALLLYWRNVGQAGRHLWTLLLVANLAALAASYSLANGNLLWLILIAAAILLRLPLSAILSFVVTGTMSSTFYLMHYVRPRWHADPLTSLKTPVKLVEYLTGYLGSSWFHRGVHLAAPLGLLALATAVIIVSGFLSYVRTRRAFAIQLALTLVFCLGTVFITALGRLNFGPGQSFASRYQTIALLFWCCLGLMAMLWASETPVARFPMIVVQITLLLIMARGAQRAHLSFEDARLHSFRVNQTAVSLLTGVPDEENFESAIGLKPQDVAAETWYLRNKRLSVFSSDAYRQLDRALTSAFQIVDPRNCRGELQSSSSIGSAENHALAISGWAWDYQDRSPPEEIIASDNGVITGLAAVGDDRPTVTTVYPEIRSNFVGFAGYVHDVQPSTPLEIYAVLGGSPPEACLIATQDPAAIK